MAKACVRFFFFSQYLALHCNPFHVSNHFRPAYVLIMHAHILHVCTSMRVPESPQGMHRVPSLGDAHAHCLHCTIYNQRVSPFGCRLAHICSVYRCRAERQGIYCAWLGGCWRQSIWHSITHAHAAVLVPVECVCTYAVITLSPCRLQADELTTSTVQLRRCHMHHFMPMHCFKEYIVELTEQQSKTVCLPHQLSLFI